MTHVSDTARRAGDHIAGVPRRASGWPTFAVVAPFAAFLAFFLAWPTLAVFWGAVTPGGSFSLSSLGRALSGTYRTSFVNSTLLSAASAVIGGVIGTWLALVVRRVTRRRWVHPAINSWSAVASQLGGVPLAFAFIALLGSQGLLTRALQGLGVDLGDSGFSLSGFWGLVLVYLYFQIPLMFLVMMPAVGGLRPNWREASALMGASSATYWRRIAGPVLLPSFLGGVVLLFVNAFSAYATAYVLNSGGQLVPLQVRFVLQGNVITGEQDLGYALVAWTIVLLLGCLLLVAALQRRTARWTRA